MNHSHNIVVNGRELVAQVMLATDVAGARAALIRICEQGKEVAMVQLAA